MTDLRFPWKVNRTVVDEPGPGESGTIYEYEVVDKAGKVLVTTYDEAVACFIAAAPDLLRGAEDLFEKLPEAAMLGAKLRLAVVRAKEARS